MIVWLLADLLLIAAEVHLMTTAGNSRELILKPEEKKKFKKALLELTKI